MVRQKSEIQESAVLFAKVFLYCFVPFALVILVASLVVSSVLPSYSRLHPANGGLNFWLGTAGGGALMFALIMGVFLVAYQLIAFRVVNRGKGLDLSLPQTRVLRVEAPLEVTRNICATILRNVASRVNTLEDGRLSARMGMTWNSWGEYVEVNVVAVDEMHSEVRIRSKPVLPTNIIDGGKNFQNVERLSSFVQDMLRLRANGNT